MTKEQIEAIRARCEAFQNDRPIQTDSSIELTKALLILDKYLPSFSDLAANSVKGIPALLAEVERLWEARRWIPVTERLPECETTVLISADVKRYDGTTRKIVCTAMYEDGTIHEDKSDFDWGIDYFDMEYLESEDCYLVPEGWFEQGRYCEQFAAVSDFVTHWMPLPQPPKGKINEL